MTLERTFSKTRGQSIGNLLYNSSYNAGNLSTRPCWQLTDIERFTSSYSSFGSAGTQSPEAGASNSSVIGSSWPPSFDEALIKQERTKVIEAQHDKFRALFWALEIHRHVRFGQYSLGSSNLLGETDYIIEKDQSLWKAGKCLVKGRDINPSRNEKVHPEHLVRLCYFQRREIEDQRGM